MATSPNRPSGQRSPDRRAPEASLGVGLTFAASVALFAVGGLWLDGKLETRPWFLLLGVLLGLVGGTIHLLSALAPSALPFGKKSKPSAGADRFSPAPRSSPPPAAGRRQDPHSDDLRPPTDDGQPS